MALADAVPYAVAHWALDESSGTRVDSIGSNDLTDNNTVGVGTGLFGNCADFERDDSEYLSIADNAALSCGDVDFTFACWINPESSLRGRTIAGKGANASVNMEWRASGFGSFDRLSFAVGYSGNNSRSVAQDGSIATGVWHLLVVWHDSVNNLIGISWDGAAATTTAHSDGVNDGVHTLCLGKGGSNDAGHMDGLMDDAVFLKGYVLSNTEIAELWNSGAGVAFADWAGGGGVTGTASIPLDAITLSGAGTVATSGTGGATVDYIATHAIGTDGTVFTAAGASIGAADSSRVVAVIVSSRSTTGQVLSGVTIGGNAATIVDTIRDSDSGTGNSASIAVLAVPAGTTATIEATFASTQLRCAITVYRLTQVDIESAVVAKATGNTGTPLDLDLAVVNGGVVIAGGMGNSGSSPTASWTGLTEDYDNPIESVTVVAASAAVTTTETRDVAVQWTTGGGAAIAVSFESALGPTPTYTSGSDSVAFSGANLVVTPGITWNGHSNGTVTELRDVYVEGVLRVADTALTTIDLSSWLSDGDEAYVVTKATNTGGTDAGEWQTSAVATYVAPASTFRQHPILI